jgi:hypothetical protein
MVARDTLPSVATKEATGPPRHKSKTTNAAKSEVTEAASAIFLSVSQLAVRLQGYRPYVWAQLLRLDGTVPPAAVEIPADLQDMCRCYNRCWMTRF